MKIFFMAAVLSVWPQMASAQMSKTKALELFDHQRIIPWQGEVIPGHTIDASTQPMTTLDGYLSIFVGHRKSEISPEGFRAKIARHIDHVRSKFGPMGLKAYFIVVEDDFEVAIQSWSSKAAAQRAFDANTSVILEAEQIMNPSLFESLSHSLLPLNIKALQRVCYETGDVWLDCD